MATFELPGGVTVEAFDDDLVVMAVNMDEARFRVITAELPAETMARVIGWKRTAR